MMKLIAPVTMALALAGCFTLSETPYPQTAMVSVPEGKNVSIQIRGFKSVVTEYMPVYGYDNVWVSGHPHGRYGWTPGRYHTVMSTTYVPQMRESDAFVQRAVGAAEKSGFVTMAEKPDYIVDATFGGPVVDSDDMSVRGLWLLLSALSADYVANTWTAQLKVYDNSTGKLVFHHDYSQRYQVAVWGPIPLFSPACSPKNDAGAIQNWCLAALTDRMMADVSAFIASKAK